MRQGARPIYFRCQCVCTVWYDLLFVCVCCFLVLAYLSMLRFRVWAIYIRSNLISVVVHVGLIYFQVMYTSRIPEPNLLPGGIFLSGVMSDFEDCCCRDQCQCQATFKYSTILSVQPPSFAAPPRFGRTSFQANLYFDPLGPTLCT